MHIEPHAGNAEWKRVGEHASLERALLATGLPPASAFDVVERTASGPPTIYAWGDPGEAA